MMHMPMTVQMIVRHGLAVFPESCVSTFDGSDFRRSTFAQVGERAELLAGALAGLGVERGDRVGTFCWNHQEHLEAYLAIPSLGAILHTVNIRLSTEQLVYVINHAGDRVLIVDAVLLGLLQEVLPQLDTVEHIIIVGGSDKAELPSGALDYEMLLAGGHGGFEWPELDDNSAAAICYTTGTTGHPKGVVYGHRTTFVHSLAARATDTFGISEADRILLLPPMFHANAWGLPFTAWMSGSDLIMPGPHLQADAIVRQVHSERPTFTAMVPTLINDLFAAHDKDPIDMSSFRMLVSGGSAVAPGLIRAAKEKWGVPVLQGWGMTETSPLCALSTPPRNAGDDDSVWRAKSGRPIPGVEVRAVDADGRPVAHNGVDTGELQLRGPWVTGSYYRNQSPESFTADGWLRTGDVGTIDERHFVQITDRIKDVIKSGGEWISSVDLENRLLAHENVREVAVVAVDHPRWEERPLAVIVPTDRERFSARELRAWLEGQVAKFWIPEFWSVVDELPKTSVGKIDKKKLRELVRQRAFVIEEVNQVTGDG